MNVYLYPSNTETELKNIYIGEYKGWKPGSNTYIYYPLTSNLVDQMGNGNTGTMTGTCTFDSSTGIHVTGRSGNYVTGLSNGINNRNLFTLNIWAKKEDNNNGSYLLGYSTSAVSTQCLNLSQRSGNLNLDIAFSGYSSALGGIVAFNTNWHNRCIVVSSNTEKVYLDGVLIATNNCGTTNNVSEMQLGWGGTYGSSRSGNGYIKDYIVETVAWSADQVLSYYNQTKSNYGL